MAIALQRFNDGTFINWGRHWRGLNINGRPVYGEGAAVFYTGEAAEVISLIIKHQQPTNG